MSIYKLAKSCNNDKSDKSKKSHTLRNSLLAGTTTLAAAPGIYTAGKSLRNPAGFFGIATGIDPAEFTNVVLDDAVKQGLPKTLKSVRKIGTPTVGSKLQLAASGFLAPYLTLGASTVKPEARRALRSLFKSWMPR